MVLYDVLRLVGGIILLVVGATGLVLGGSALARRMGVSSLWIGLTVVSVGTTMPELLVSSTAALAGRPGVAVGNVVGSVVLNLLVVLAISALVAPVAVGRVTVRRDITILAGIAALVWGLSLDGRFHWAEGAILLAFVIPYGWRIYVEEKRGWVAVVEPPKGLEERPLWVQLAALIGGLAVLVLAARFVVQGAIGIADSFGIEGRIVGLTIVALGTSLPELATAVIAIRRREADLAVGNIVGANILNLILVLGTATTLGTMDVPDLTRFMDIPVMLGSIGLVWVFAATHHRISRVEGALLLGVYLLYVGLLLGGALAF